MQQLDLNGKVSCGSLDKDLQQLDLNGKVSCGSLTA
jgi:hypothetical protein